MSRTKGPVLLTGGAGVVGSYVVRELVGAGYRPTVVDRVAGDRFRREFEEHIDLRLLDIRDATAVEGLFRAVQPETVLHLAALTGSASPDEPMVMYGINMTGTMHVMEAARKAGVKRLVFASTRTVYPEFAGTRHGAPDYVPVTEDHWLGPDRPYETWKAAAEHMGTFYRRRFGMEFAAFRFAIYYAAERTLNPGGRAMGMIHQLIRNAATGQPTFIPGGRDQAMDCIYAADIANAFRCAVEAESVPSTAYNIGYGERVTPADFAAAVRAAVPDAPVEIGDGAEFAEGHYCVLDIGRARREIGLAPKWPLAAGVSDCIERTRALLASIENEAKTESKGES